MRFELYQCGGGAWRWRAVDLSGDTVVAKSELHFPKEEDAVMSISLFVSAMRHQENMTVWSDNKFLTHV